MRIDHIGTEKHPVVLIDDLLQNSQQLVEIAAGSTFTKQSAFYPGPRAKTPPQYAPALAQALGPVIREIFGWGADEIVPTESNFSLVTTPPERLTPPQRIPHFDAVDANLVAVLHYLCDEKNGGTAFYRHRSSGFESVTAERREAYGKALTADTASGYMPPLKYLNGSTPLFERIGGYDCVFNRILIYRGIMLHSGSIPEDLPLSDDPKTGRLTVNTFLRRAPRGT